MEKRYLTVLLLPLAAFGQSAPQAARTWREAHEKAIVAEFTELLSIPNVARDLPNIRRNAAAIRAMLEKRGAATRLLEVPNAPPAVYGEINTPGATQTVIFYAHYDGQPVEPKEWIGGDPFKPVIRNTPDPRIYARSASDDKAPLIAWVSALDALRAARIPLRSHIKFFLEGEEEAGSRHLGDILKANKDLLKGDVWIFCDGPVHQNRQQQVVFGARGSVGLQLTVYGPRRELHSGHYGNWAPNPIVRLAHLLTTMRDEEGRILIAGYYDDVVPLNDRERRAIAEAPRFDDQIKEELWLKRAEGNGRRLDELINLPALNLRGISSAGVGEQSRNVIPTSATASIDLRLVKGMDAQRAVGKLIAHVRAQGYHVVDTEPDAATRLQYPKVARIHQTDGYNAVRADMDQPIARKVIQAVESARGKVVLMPTSGGSLPLTVFEEVLATPVICVPIANHDNNQHGHNENIRLQNLWDGIETMAALLVL